jgi:phosphatidylglycerophosphatase A
LILWIAQGFGIGRIPFAPGTLGSLVGVLWLLLLLAPGQLWVWLIGMLGGIALSVWACGRAEKRLQRTDPGSVVLDEIVAIPVCFAGWTILELQRHERLLSPAGLFQPGAWPWLLAVLAGFRFFDILKPWPIRQSQALPGGWGVTADDLLAAVYVNLLFLAAYSA